MTMKMTREQHIEQTMDRHRIRRDLQWKQVAEGAGISIPALTEIRKGRANPRELTKARIERVLGWAPGSLDRVLAGGDPVVVSTADAPMTLSEAAAVFADEALDRNVPVQQVIDEHLAKVSGRKRSRNR